MKNYSTEILSKRIDKLEERVNHSTEVQADIYTQITEITETLEIISKTVREIRQELRTIKKQFGNTGTTTEPRH